MDGLFPLWWALSWGRRGNKCFLCESEASATWRSPVAEIMVFYLIEINGWLNNIINGQTLNLKQNV